MDEKRLSVCLLNESFPPVIDGVANAVLNYAEIIHRKYGSAVVAVPSYPGAEDNYPFPVVRYPSIDTTKSIGYRTGIPYWPSTIHELAKYRPDVLHAHSPFVSVLMARALRSLTGAPIILTYHTKFDIDIKNAVEMGFLQAAAIKFIVSNIEACDEVWVVSNGAGENLRSLGYTGDYIVMENGVDFQKGRAPSEDVERISSELCLEPGVPVFLYVGRMMWYKGIRIILEGLFKAKAAGNRFKMVFVGDGADLGEIRELSDSLKLAGDCVFTGAIRDRRKLRAIFSRADMFLFPSTFDTNGIVVREAAACGLASVLVRGSCAAEGIADGRHGILIDENADSLAAAVARVCADLEGARRMGLAAMEEIYFSWEDAVARAFERYSAVVENYVSARRISGDDQDGKLYRLAGDIEKAMEKLRAYRSRYRLPLPSGRSRYRPKWK